MPTDSSRLFHHPLTQQRLPSFHCRTQIKSACCPALQIPIAVQLNAQYFDPFGRSLPRTQTFFGLLYLFRRGINGPSYHELAPVVDMSHQLSPSFFACCISLQRWLCSPLRYIDLDIWLCLQATLARDHAALDRIHKGKKVYAHPCTQPNTRVLYLCMCQYCKSLQPVACKVACIHCRYTNVVDPAFFGPAQPLPISDGPD